VFNGLRPRGATRDIDINGDDLIHALHHAVDVIHPPTIRTGTHGDHPFGFCHLFIKPQHDRSNFLEDGSGDNQEVSLARRTTQDLSSEPSEVITGCEDRCHFDKATGCPEKQGPEAILTGPVDQ
jgi:hypothetical protein